MAEQPIIVEGAPSQPSPVSPPSTVAEGGRRKGSMTLLVVAYTAAIFLNAALLFAVQPMFTKMVLPLLGGSPAVWNTCLLFFQTALLGGYLYAHLTSRWFKPRVQAFVHLGLMVAAITLLPISVPEAWSTPPAGSLPIPWLLGLLTVALGLPFFLLSAGAPMLQRWFATTAHPAAENPYFLYAASNLGSFTALLAYPFVIEPRLRLTEQSVSWLAFYYVLVVLIAMCAVGAQLLRRRTPRGQVMVYGDTPPAIAQERGEPATGAVAATTGDRPVSAMEANGGSADEASSPDQYTLPGFEHAADAVGNGQPERRRALGGTLRLIRETKPSVMETLLRDPPPREPTIVPGRAWRLRWVLLAFAPSSLLVGVTTYISTDIASVPFLWVVPLALYLLTFVIVFARRPLVPRQLILHAQLVLGLVLVVLLCIGAGVRIAPQAMWHLLAFFVTALMCHRELADARPRAEYLTEFYLWMSFGGVLGGAFNVLVAPTLYNSLIEYPFALVIAFGLRPPATRAPGGTRDLLLDVALPALVLLGVWAGFKLPTPPTEWFSHGTALYLGLWAGIVLLFWRRPLRLALGAGAIYAAVQLNATVDQDVLLQRRSFFGIYRVRRILEYHVLQHGTTTHGGQSRQAARRTEMLTYYHREGPLGDIFETIATDVPLRRVAVVGLGTGTTACYGRAGERWTFFEIDPLVVRIARTPSLFTYLRDCPPDIEIALGDARLSLAREPDGEFDLIVLDAFSSDAIPVHLLTREALAIYLAKLRPGGAVAFHISNRYLDLRPVLLALANDARVPGLVGDLSSDDEDRVKLWYGSRWVVLAKEAATLGALRERENWNMLSAEQGARLWTDDYSDVLGVMRW